MGSASPWQPSDGVVRRFARTRPFQRKHSRIIFSTPTKFRHSCNSQKLLSRLRPSNGAAMPTAKNVLQTKTNDEQLPIHGSNTDLLAASLREMLLRVDAVCTITGLSVPTIYRMMSQGGFPRPLKITSHARAWRLSDINAWIDSRELGGTP